MTAQIDCSIHNTPANQFQPGAKFIVHSPLLVMRLPCGGRAWVSLKTGTPGLVAETYGDAGRDLLMLRVNGESFLAWRRDVEERCEVSWI